MSINGRALLPYASDRRDILRLAVQAGSAAALTAVASRLLGSSDTFLAVISAVLVLQRNRDATIDSAGERLAGAVAGTIVGFAAQALTASFLPEAGPLFLALAVMGAITAWRAGLRYGLVAAAGLALASEGDLLPVAQSRTIAIFLGAGIGIAVGFLVLPEGALSRARRQLGEVLDLCRALLDRTVGSALGKDEAEVSDLHSRFSRSLATVRDTVSATTLRRLPVHQAFRNAVHGTERLWHALIILDRVMEGDRDPLPLDREARDRFDAIRGDAAEALAFLSRFERVPDEDLKALQEACRKAHSRLGEGAGEEEQLRTDALVFGLSEVSRNIAELSRTVCHIAAAH